LSINNNNNRLYSFADRPLQSTSQQLTRTTALQYRYWHAVIVSSSHCVIRTSAARNKHHRQRVDVSVTDYYHLTPPQKNCNKTFNDRFM